MIKNKIYIFIIILIFISIDVQARVTIPKEKIPENVSNDVRNAIISLYSSDGSTRRDGILLIKNMGANAKEAIPFLIELLDDTTKIVHTNDNGTVKTVTISFFGEEVADALASIGATAVEPLITALKNGDVNTQKNAIIALGITKDMRAVEALIKKIGNKDDKDPLIEKFAIKALADITGVDFGGNRIEWNKWWIKNKKR